MGVFVLQKTNSQSPKSIYSGRFYVILQTKKKCRAKYYGAKVKQLGRCAPATWWKEIKRLSGISEPVSRRDNTVSMLSNIERNSDPNSPSEAELANEINKAFLRPMTDFTPLLLTTGKLIRMEDQRRFVFRSFPFSRN